MKITMPDYEVLAEYVIQMNTRERIQLLKDLFDKGYALGKNNDWKHNKTTYGTPLDENWNSIS